ncbi:ABC transporter substrate-binding protein [uncultured Arthrobacter sp.]|uniref:ABC transporter substrate-binding protein n=1 Tax=uncultured Arthrobacter sp. TaxID=114050 RepID=UPI0025FC99B0|nr:extracellular solute-binding protein [uncultured Arthrobacter sp.]
MKTRKSLAIAAALGLTLSACATGTGGSQTAEDSQFDPEAEVSGELNIMGFGATDEIGETRVKSAEEKLDGVKVSLVEGDLDIQQFLSAVASGEPPALIYANRNQLGTFASRGAIMPLNECINAHGIQVDHFRAAAMSQVTFEDEVYGVPEFNQVQIVMGHSALLEEQGLSVEDIDGSDWDGIRKAADTLVKNKGKLSVIGYDTKLPEFLPIWAKANGADILSADGRKAQLNDPAVVEALEFASEIYEKQGGFSAVKAFRDSADFFGEGNQFASNTLGAMPMEQWYVNILNDVSPDAPMAFTTLKDTSGETMSYSSGSAWAIPKGSSNPEAACRFIEHMTKVDTWMEAATARADMRAEEGKPFTGLFTGNQAADERIKEEFVKVGSDPKWDAAIEASYEANEASFALPASPADAEFETAWEDAVNRVLNGQQEPQAALDQAQEEAQQALDEAWSSWDEE